MSEQEVIPSSDSPEWVPFIMSKFEKSELIEGNPTYYGIRRVFRKYFATINNCITEVIVAPSKDDKRAAVKCTVVCTPFGQDTPISQDGTSDVCDDTLEAPFDRHLLATVETMAEGRALRKLLGLKVATAEEMLPGEEKVEKANPQMINGIRTACKNRGINLDTFLIKFGGLNEATFESKPETVSKQVALKLLEKLNSFATEAIPDDIKTT